MKKIPFKLNGTVIVFLVIGLGLSLIAYLFGSSLWLGSDARWSSTSFLLMFLFATLALIFLGFAGVLGKYAVKNYVGFPQPPLRKVITVGLLCLAGLGAWFAGIFYLSKYIDRQIYLTRTAETPAEIISESSYTSGSRKNVTTTYTYKYSYKIDDRTYEAVSDSFKPLKKGGAVKACYNPANPHSSQIRAADFQCGNEGKYE